MSGEDMGEVMQVFHLFTEVALPPGPRQGEVAAPNVHPLHHHRG